jgi:large subunit ribosomal protein L15
MILKLYGKEYFGKHGFKRPLNKVKHIKFLNIEDLDKNLNFYLEKNLVKKEDSFYNINLDDLGYNKLLGSGSTKNKYKIIGNISKKAKEKIEEAGGLVEGN